MTLTSAQNQVAQRYHYSDWKEAMSDLPSECCEDLQYEADSLYQTYDRSETSKVTRIVFIVYLVMLIAALLAIAAYWINQEPMPGDRDYSGYGAFEGRRY